MIVGYPALRGIKTPSAQSRRARRPSSQSQPLSQSSAFVPGSAFVQDLRLRRNHDHGDPFYPSKPALQQRTNSLTRNAIRIGTAGWSIPKPLAAHFTASGTHLQRYAQRFTAVEINSSFYRPHKPETYARWAASVPAGFRFAVKVPREITHSRKLLQAEDPLHRFLEQTEPLGCKRGPLLVQLPPSLHFNEAVAGAFFDLLRSQFEGLVVCEPRHPSWFAANVDALLSQRSIARVLADPPPVPEAARPGGYTGIVYRRLHGSPRIYYSPYPSEYLDHTARQIQEPATTTQENWCIFDNTALGEATSDALSLAQRLL